MMFCPICNIEIDKDDLHCPGCGTQLQEDKELTTFVLQPVFIKSYEIFNYLIRHVLTFVIVMIIGYMVCVWQQYPMIFLLILFPIYLGIAVFQTNHLNRLYQGIHFTFYQDHVTYENEYYPHLNGEISYDDIGKMVAYQNFLDYFYGVGHIKIKMSSNPHRGMLLKNMVKPNETYEKLKEIMQG